MVGLYLVDPPFLNGVEGLPVATGVFVEALIAMPVRMPNLGKLARSEGSRGTNVR